MRMGSEHFKEYYFMSLQSNAEVQNYVESLQKDFYKRRCSNSQLIYSTRNLYLYIHSFGQI